MAKKIMVAMSGGVDSSVAALLLKERGCDVVGVTMCFSAGGRSAYGGNIAASHRKKPVCCGIESIEDAKKVAHQLNIPHYVLNFSKQLEEVVILDFILEYTSGRTPNPCVRCNQYLKFGELLRRARSLDIHYLATGHYARIEKKDKTLLLKKGFDQKKDQSYFLCQVRQNQLAHLIFPVGDMTKQEVRDLAKKKGLYVADKFASQEVCFIPDNNYRSFLKERLNKAFFKEGDIVDKEGKILGLHHGIFNFTIGQREGLGISAGHPLYVISLNEANNQVVVGEREDVYSKSLVAVEPNILIKDAFKKKVFLYSKIRYNHPQAASRVTFLNRGKLKVDFLKPQAAITPGQFVVFYKGDVLLGGAKILERL